MSLRDDIFNELSRRPRTIAELTDLFGVTRNSVVVQLKQLESAGLVAREASRRGGQVGKPATVYAATSGHEDRSSTAYRAFSEMLVRALGEQLNPAQREKFFHKMGSREGQAMAAPGEGSLRERLAEMQAFADRMGAATTLEETDAHYVLRSFTCPIAALVRIEPCACTTLAALFQEMTGRPTKEACRREGKLICQFEIEKA